MRNFNVEYKVYGIVFLTQVEARSKSEAANLVMKDYKFQNPMSSISILNVCVV